MTAVRDHDYGVPAFRGTGQTHADLLEKHRKRVLRQRRLRRKREVTFAPQTKEAPAVPTDRKRSRRRRERRNPEVYTISSSDDSNTEAVDEEIGTPSPDSDFQLSSPEASDLEDGWPKSTRAQQRTWWGDPAPRQ